MALEGWITLAMLAVQTVGLIVGGIWALSRMEATIRKEISDHRLENEERVNATTRAIGETFTAIRQKVTEVELYMRDNYVQKNSFQAVTTQIMNDVRGIGDRIEARLLRMETKLDDVKRNSD